MTRLLVSPQDATSGRFVKTHQMEDSPEYRAWLNAVYRCENVNAEGWLGYGGRGITVCKQWRLSFEKFFADMGPRPTDKHSLERRNVNLGYEPENCCWATKKEQANNRRNTPRINGLSPMQLVEITGLSYAAITSRIRRGWRAERIINMPSQKNTGMNHVVNC